MDAEKLAMSNRAKISALANQTVSIKDKRFGAIGDGVTSDVAAFTAALNYCVANNKALLIPEGTYNLANLSYTATGNVRIIGMGMDNSILKGVSNISFPYDLDLEDFSILDAVGASTISLTPVGYQKLVLKNIRADNTFYAFTDTSLTNNFVYINGGADGVGLSKVDITGCDIHHYASMGFRLRCTIKSGYIARNTVSDMGFDGNTNKVIGFQLGDSSTYGVTGGVIVEQNIFDNYHISVSRGSEASGEGHFAIGYGTGWAKYRNNDCGHFYNGTTEAVGYDREALYSKIPDTEVYENYINGGCGDLSNGAITVKAPRANIHDNTISLTTGCGIYTVGVSYVYDNNIIANNSTSGIYCEDGISEVSRNHITINSTLMINGVAADCYGVIFTGVENYMDDNEIVMHVGTAAVYGPGKLKISGGHMIADGSCNLLVKTLSLTDLIIDNCSLIISGNPATETYLVLLNGDTAATEVNVSIGNSKMNMLKVQTASTEQGVIKASNITNLTVKDCPLSICNGDYFLKGTPKAGGIFLIRNNRIRLVDSTLYYSNISTAVAGTVFNGNDIEYQRGAAVSANTRLIFSYAMTSNMIEVIKNRFYINGDGLASIAMLQNKQFSFNDNEFYLEGVTTPITQLLYLYAVTYGGPCYCCGNKILTAGKAASMMYYAGSSGLNVGTTFVKDNVALLTSGNLINAQSALAATLLFVDGNEVQSTSSGGKTIKTTIQPSSGYTAGVNYEF
jgi:hypothetical protein